MKYRLMSVLFPPRCGGCGTLLHIQRIGDEYLHLCPACMGSWTSELLDSCGGCGQAVSECTCAPEEITRAKGMGLWKRVYYLHGKNYATQNRILFKIKRKRAKTCIDFLSCEMERSLQKLISDNQPDLSRTRLIYLPRSKRSLCKNGVDQGKALAHALSRRTSIPIEPIIRRYPRKNVRQKTLSNSARRRNARESYYLAPSASPRGKIYILIDDIVTTGSTMAAGIRLLRKAGADAVYCLAVAVDDTSKNANLRQPKFKI